MADIHQIVVVADQHDVNIVVVRPVRRPGIHIFERVTAVFEAPTVMVRHMKVMLGAETGAELLLRNPVTPAYAAVRLAPIRLLLLGRLPVILARSIVLPLRLIAPVRFRFRLVFLVSGIRLRLLIGFGFLLLRGLFLFLLVLLF